MNRQTLKGDKLAPKHMKRCLMSIIMQEILIKTIFSFFTDQIGKNVKA